MSQLLFNLVLEELSTLVCGKNVGFCGNDEIPRLKTDDFYGCREQSLRNGVP